MGESEVTSVPGDEYIPVSRVGGAINPVTNARIVSPRCAGLVLETTLPSGRSMTARLMLSGITHSNRPGAAAETGAVTTALPGPTLMVTCTEPGVTSKGTCTVTDSMPPVLVRLETL